ncbi:MAG: YlxR family protein [Dactylosporangium sp.]|nr:YlxR family protein [Dactylosporangium sp.]NNJ59963.1 YlxR family protein [Dactylosporangium sp.]
MVRRARPVRTCVGCRERAPIAELLRVVAVRNDAEIFSLVPDPTRRRPGRGVHLHTDPACLASAQRRRVFGRALRVLGVIDAEPLVRAINDTSLRQRGSLTFDGQRQSTVDATASARTRKVGRPT